LYFLLLFFGEPEITIIDLIMQNLSLMQLNKAYFMLLNAQCGVLVLERRKLVRISNP